MINLARKITSDSIIALAAFVLPALLFRPLQIYTLNQAAIDVPISNVLFFLIIACLFILLALLFLLLATKIRFHKKIAALLVTISFGAWLNYEIIWSQYSFDFSSQAIDWKSFGNFPYIELLLLLAAIGCSYIICYKWARITNLIAFSIIVFSVISLGMQLKLNPIASNYIYSVSQNNKDDIYGMSSELNIVHLFPDAIQLDIAKQVLLDNTALAKMFEGFVFYTDNTALFPSTAPSVPSVFRGKAHNLMTGYVPENVASQMDVDAYPVHLSNAGFRLDYASIAPLYCPGNYSSCLNVSFNDLRSRSYTSEEQQEKIGLALLFDLTLFRQVPLIIKKWIFNDGNWFFSDILSRKSNDVYRSHAPVLSEWAEMMRVNGARPSYKFYHWIGAHTPPQWNANCEYLGPQTPSRSAFYAQTECALKKISEYIEALKEKGIFDNTMIIISSDHGNAIEPLDVVGYRYNPDFQYRTLGHARTLLMIKPFASQGKLRYSSAQTSLIDIAPTILESLNINLEHEGVNVLDVAIPHRIRNYYKYNASSFTWSEVPVAFDLYEIIGNSNEWTSWRLNTFFPNSFAPTELSPTLNSDYTFMRGISGNGWVHGKELFLQISPQGDGPYEISFQLHIPEKIKDQLMQVYINGIAITDEITVNHIETPWFQTLSFCVNKNFVKNSNNLFRLSFSHAIRLNDSDQRYFSAILGNVLFRTSANCNN